MLSGAAPFSSGALALVTGAGCERTTGAGAPRLGPVEHPATTSAALTVMQTRICFIQTTPEKSHRHSAPVPVW